jgi:UTP--glucose-1-phosphate uridylyltransferase
MVKKITKAVIPAAGLGTRMLPIARTVPKEMLPIVDRPAISYLVEEAAASGITDVLIITNRNKETIENYFDYSPEYEETHRQAGKYEYIEKIRAICSKVNVMFLRQLETKGLGHAVLRAKAFVGDEPFAVLYGDDIIISETPVVKQLTEVYAKTGLGVLGVKEVSDELITRYCTLDAKETEKGLYTVTDMIEKPKKEEIITNLSILGRVILPPEIFEILENTPPGAGGEIQLTDAMRTLANKQTMMAVDFEGKRYDMGSKMGFLMANVEQALKSNEFGQEFRDYLKELVKNI